MKHQNLILTALIAMTAIVGDKMVFTSPYSDSHIYRGILDNLVHTAIGLLSSVLFLTYDVSHTANAIAFNAAVCTAISSLIDFDHVIVARSIYWKDLKNFKHRGILHCSSVWFGVSALAIAAGRAYKKLNYSVLGWMLLIAFTSHHVRDAHRRGFWLWPCGHTPALNRGVYVAVVALLPTAYYWLYRQLKPGTMRYTTVDHYVDAV